MLGAAHLFNGVNETDYSVSTKGFDHGLAVTLGVKYPGSICNGFGDAGFRGCFVLANFELQDCWGNRVRLWFVVRHGCGSSRCLDKQESSMIRLGMH